MVCNSILGDGDTSGSSIRAKRYPPIFKKLGYEVIICSPLIQKKIHPAINFMTNALFSLRYIFYKCKILYSISDLFPDVFFAYIYHLSHPKTIFICGVHSIVQKKIKGRTKIYSCYAYYSQKIILWFLKHSADKILVSNDYDNEILKTQGFKNVRTVYPAPNF